MNAPFFKTPPITNRKYLDSLRGGPCIVTLECGTEDAPVCEPAHLRLLGSAGMGQKPQDSLCLPLHWRLHRRQTNLSEGGAWLAFANEYPDFLLRTLKEVAEFRYRKWLGK